jgi:hypothetical protein
MQTIRLRAYTDGDFTLTLPVTGLVGTAVIKAQFRVKATDPDPALLSFASNTTTGANTITLDVTDQQLTFYAPQSAVAALNGLYVFDVVQVQGGQRDVLATGTCLFVPGPTRS